MFKRTFAAGLFIVLSGVGCFSQSQWPFAGHDLQDTRFQNTETKISPASVPGLAVTWKFGATGGVLATPAVDGSTVYFPDSGGKLYAVDKKTGKLVWVQTIETYTGIAGNLSVTTPAISGSLLFVGDEGGLSSAGAKLLAIRKQTGTLVWSTVLDHHPTAIVTQSPVVASVNGQTIVFVGVDSMEDILAADPTYPCCSFRGSTVAVNATTGQIIWKTFTVPIAYTGGAVAGGTPVVDSGRGSLYVVTGNNYTVPVSVLDCLNGGGTVCTAPDDLFDSIVALDLVTGTIKWAYRTLQYDAWNDSCLPGQQPANCPNPAGPGFGFSGGAALFFAQSANTRVPTLGAGQRSGKYWAVDPNTGAIIWDTQVGPGSPVGGLGAAAAVDNRLVYVAEATSGSWAALDASTGATIWQTSDPAGAPDVAPISVANGVVYACSLEGHMYAMNAETGGILWTFQSGGSCAAGAAVSNGTAYWGSGGSQLFAFQAP